MLLDFGRPPGSVIQYAYVVEDIESEILRYTDRLRVGPWFIRRRFVPPEGRYRGQPTAPTFTLARAFAGTTMIELIQQHDDSPSVYHEGPGERRYGFHHWAMLTGTFDEDVARYAARNLTFRDGRLIKDEAVADPADAREMLATLPPEEDEDAA